MKEEYLEQVERREQVEPPPDPSNDKEVSTEAHPFITIPLKTQHEPQASSFQCLEEPSYVEIFKESHIEDHKSRNRVPKWILWNTVNYIRWRNILQEGYLILKKKGWKELVGHPWDRGRRSNFSFLFSALYFLSFYFLLFYFHFVLFLTAINLLMFVLVRKD